MVGPLVYDLAQQHVSELLSERAMDRLAAEVPRTERPRAPRLDFRLTLPLFRRPNGSAPARA